MYVIIDVYTHIYIHIYDYIYLYGIYERNQRGISRFWKSQVKESVPFGST